MEYVILRQMTEEEYHKWRAWSVKNYVNELVKARNINETDAKAQAETEFSNLLPEHLATRNHFLFSADSTDGNTVGMIWYERCEPLSVFICDFVVYDGFKRMGYGSLILKELERRLRRDGITRIELHTFETNAAALSLYKKCGFSRLQTEEAETGSVYLEKHLFG